MTMDDLLVRPSPSPPGAPAQPGAGTSGRPNERERHDGAWKRWSTSARGTWERLAAWDHFDALLLVALVVLALGLRWRTMWASYWGDEAIAIGIASHPIASLPHYLANDGSPPLFYLMLHYWMELFGRSTPATHALSMIGGLLAIPAAWWSGERLFGRRAARGAAALVATCAYLDYYSTETRMYSWLVLAAILAITCFVLAFRGAGPRYWVAATVFMSAVLYLQYYGLYLLAATVIIGSAAALTRGSRELLRATLLYGLACAAAFAPWAPQFFYQLYNTGAPWAPHPSVLDFFGDSFNALASAAWAVVLLAIAIAVFGRRRGTPVAGGTRAAWSPMALTAAIALLTLVLAWCVAQFVNSWNPRYLGIVAVPALIPLAGGLARVRWGSVALCGTVAALAFTAVPVVVDQSITVQTSKSDVAYLLGRLRPVLHPGALVISTEVTDMPVLALGLGRAFQYATPFGLSRDPLVVDWSDLSSRLRDSSAASDLAPLLAKLPAGGQVLVVNPTTWDRGETPEAYAGPVVAEAIAANQVILDDPQLRALVTEGVPRHSRPLYPMRATLFVKMAAPSEVP
jgi:mannosyltransferase